VTVARVTTQLPGTEFQQPAFPSPKSSVPFIRLRDDSALHKRKPPSSEGTVCARRYAYRHPLFCTTVKSGAKQNLQHSIMDPLQSGDMSAQEALEAALRADLSGNLAGNLGPYMMGYVYTVGWDRRRQAQLTAACSSILCSLA
jgi:hypothetical protein